ncbi:hypothetical protein [Mycobacterium sp. NPDC050853]
MRHNIARALRKIANRVDPAVPGDATAEGLRIANAAVRAAMR